MKKVTHFWGNLSVKYKVLFPTIIVIAIFASTIYTIVYNNNRDVVLHNAKIQGIQTTEQTSKYMGQILDIVINQFYSVELDEEFVKFCKNEENSLEEKQSLKKKFQRICDSSFGYVNNIFIYKTDGTFFYDTNYILETTEAIDVIMDENVVFLGLSENSDYATYRQAVNKLIAEHENFTSAADLGIFVKNQVMVLLVDNQSDSEIMNEAIEKYYAEYGIGIDEYKKFSSYTVLKTLLSKNYASPTEFGDAVKNRLSQLKNSGGGSGGSGSSGGSGGISVGKTNPADIYTGAEISNFKDVLPTDWFCESVNALKTKGVISSAEYFRPQSNVTREEFIKMLVVALGMTDTSAETEFGDTVKGNWHYTYIASAVKKGIVKGIGNNMFGVGIQITRQDMAVMAYNAAKLAGKEFDTTHGTPFSDSADISSYAQEAVYAMRNSGVIKGMGDNTFAPLELCTRAQAAKIIYSLI